ncbi:hypothetical protein [Pseudomonas orientalis]|uniref:hypothetical protein n=1 Tax=Pseudomonas orientalis TaxID=76758 RepID=UPI000F71E144|nr:hypothetical protein [Pseudomonas orientalis]AZE88596.1 Membrane anchored protein [Pseudomonas orientalis]
MSVSASNQSFTSLLDSPAQPQVEAKLTIAAKVQVTSGPTYGQAASPGGPVYASQAQFSAPDSSISSNPMPTATNYGKQSNEVLAQSLLDKYNTFKPWYARSLTPQHVNNMARRPLTGNPDKDANIKLAKELIDRPGLMQALDRNGGTGALDQSLSKQDIRNFIFSSSPLKLQDDRQLAQNVLNNFNALKGPWWSADRNAIDVNTFAKFAERPLYGHVPTDNLTQLSREIMNRSELKGSMDNVFGFLRDGKITRNDLYRLLR